MKVNRKTVTIVIALGLAESTYLIGDINLVGEKGRRKRVKGVEPKKEGQDDYQGQLHAFWHNLFYTKLCRDGVSG